MSNYSRHTLVANGFEEPETRAVIHTKRAANDPLCENAESHPVNPAILSGSTPFTDSKYTGN